MFQDIRLMNCMKREEAEMKETRVQVGFKSSICILSGKAISYVPHIPNIYKDLCC